MEEASVGQGADFTGRGAGFAASLLFGNTKSTFGIPQVQCLEQFVPTLGTFFSNRVGRSLWRRLRFGKRSDSLAFFLNILRRERKVLCFLTLEKGVKL